MTACLYCRRQVSTIIVDCFLRSTITLVVPTIFNLLKIQNSKVIRQDRSARPKPIMTAYLDPMPSDELL